MDLETVRSDLPSLTRQQLGEKTTIHPMREGKMGASADPDLEPQVDVNGRFDFAPDLEQIGGGRTTEGNRAKVISPHASVSYALADLAWVPQQGNHIERRHPVSGELERYRVDRLLEPLPAVVLCVVSRI
jgi:hypothetical protein